MSKLPMDDVVACGTPAYVYELDELGVCYDLLRSFLPSPSDLYYSLKANPHTAIVRRLLELGCRAEVTSEGELLAAITAGARPGEILYTGPAKRDDDIRQALASGVRRFSVDSAAAMRELGELSRNEGDRVSALLRVNPEQPIPGVGLAMTGTPSQFGADLRWIEEEPESFTGYPGIAVEGVHLYLATNLADEDVLIKQFSVAIDAAARVQDRLGFPLQTIDLGGGFGAPYAREGSSLQFPTLAERLKELLSAAFPDWQSGHPAVAFESGRYLSSTCGHLVTRVLDVKESQGRTVVVCESGINHLGGMAGLRRVPPINPAVQTPDDTTDETEAMVSGPLCTPLDTWAKNAPVPADLQAGDLTVIPNVGAYGLSASLALFLGHPLPVEIVLDGQRVIECTRLEVHRSHAPIPTTETTPRR